MITRDDTTPDTELVVHPWLVAAVRPALTWVFVTLPRWVRWWQQPIPPASPLPPEWLARHTYDEGSRGDDLW